ncbi:unnamed protein product [Citrullus colocynthis]|uniref:Uncharacterized protein n=1 Tax=Citrullus colocynthis TaxID=252529 RepID=A0ABP0XTJ9_9ROSI
MVLDATMKKEMSAEACIIDVIGESNPEHFFVATQDTNLRKQLQQKKDGDAAPKRSRKAKTPTETTVQ